MSDQTAVLISEQLYDSLARPSVKTATDAKNTGAINQQAFVFEPGFIQTRSGQNAAFNGGALSGKVQTWADRNNYTLGDDPQYAYSGSYFETDPLSREVQRSNPGANFAKNTPRAVTLTNGYLDNTGNSIIQQALRLSSTTLLTQYALDSQQTTAASNQQILSGSVNSFSGASGVELNYSAGNTANFILSTASSIAGAAVNPGQLSYMLRRQLSLPNAFDSNIGNAASFATYQQIDALGQYLLSSSPDTGITQNYYDNQGRLRFSQNADQSGFYAQPLVIYYLYDSLDRITEIGFFQSSWNVVTFASLCQVANQTGRPAGATALQLYSYDINPDNPSDTTCLGRLVSIQSSNTTNNQGHISVNSDSVVTETFSYDQFGRIVSVMLAINGCSYITGYFYDGLNRVIKIIYPDNSVVSYFYNVQGQVERIEFGNDSATYSYDVDGRVVTEKLSSGNVCNSYQYGNSLGQLTQISSAVTTNNQSLFTETISYNDTNGVYQNGNIQRSDFAYGSIVHATTAAYHYIYTYDIFRRLTAATAYSSSNSPLPNSWNTTSISYDMNGNKTHLNNGGTSQTLQQATGTDQLTSINEQAAYLYTNSGLMKQRANSVALNYDLIIALPISFTQAGSTIAAFVYDSEGTRVFKTSGNNMITYIRGAGSMILMEVDQANAKTQYIYGPTGLVAITSGDNTYYVIKDHLGSSRVIYNATSNQMEGHYTYNAYGRIIESSNSTVCRYLFTGQEWDNEIALYNFKARQYDPSMSMFLTPDPAHQFADPYNYVGNDPINAVDPTGDLRLRSRKSKISIVSWNIKNLSLRKLTTKAGFKDAVVGKIAKGDLAFIYENSARGDEVIESITKRIERVSGVKYKGRAINIGGDKGRTAENILMFWKEDTVKVKKLTAIDKESYYRGPLLANVESGGKELKIMAWHAPGPINKDVNASLTQKYTGMNPDLFIGDHNIYGQPHTYRRSSRRNLEAKGDFDEPTTVTRRGYTQSHIDRVYGRTDLDVSVRQEDVASTTRSMARVSDHRVTLIDVDL
jgi:RHS repeat-associated protein